MHALFKCTNIIIKSLRDQFFDKNYISNQFSSLSINVKLLYIMRNHVMIYYQLYVNGLEKSINSMLRTQLHKMYTMGKVFYYFVLQQVGPIYIDCIPYS